MEPARPTEPKRERGRRRVAAIMEAAVAVFTEKGYDAATMTEIAARSSTAIGSLYRFFPTKEALADALLLRYALQAKNGLAELQQQVPEMTLEGIADALVDFMLLLQSQRGYATALVDARSGSDDHRKRFREAMRNGVASILTKAIAGLKPAKAKVVAVVLLHMLKGVTGVASEEPASRAMLLTELRSLVRLYLVSASERAGGK
ncbi:TetR/AcrR family transcriptional regulator [Paraburkholderia lycopersici]|uniref:DNA-binding transcriptional regulator, AcrR family n=1 Tax=Paraburkholderia lycopersici TaxID=416944 RepID=A0A1G6PIU2_9BURK|nr:TetR/AcrR family transcriptional regulator [Paraburkholderia lycopersici]SDC79969.1 DNA-binding transcriptional regulator, AcrR family [Paraburkholderia lycopersici]